MTLETRMKYTEIARKAAFEGKAGEAAAAAIMELVELCHQRDILIQAVAEEVKGTRRH